MTEINHILIYRLGSLGDTIIALPAFHAVRAAFPQARITLLTNLPVASKAAPAATILGEGFFFDEVLAYPVGLRNPRQIWNLVREIRRRKITVAVNLTEFRSVKATWRDKLFFRVAGVRHLIGFTTAPEDRKPAVPDPQTGMVEWESKRLARRVVSLRQIDLDDDRWWDLRITAAEAAFARSLLAPALDAGPCLAVSLGTKFPANDWGLDNWRALVARLASRFPSWGLVLIGAPGEQAACESCRQLWRGPSVNLCGLCPPRVSAAVLRHCRVFAGHDSGPMHLAACVGVPCVGVFSARNPAGEWYPRGRHNRIIYHRTECAGCRLSECVIERKKCITGITVAEVEQAVLEIASRPAE